jgi:hypothetical protein
MASITSISVVVSTGNRPGGGTDGEVFLGICGREFNLDTASNNFEPGMVETFLLGSGSNVLSPALNDPTSPQLDTSDLSTFPKYIRFEPGSEMEGNPGWNLERVTVTVNPGLSQFKFDALANSPNLWLGQASGKFLYLK